MKKIANGDKIRENSSQYPQIKCYSSTLQCIVKNYVVRPNCDCEMVKMDVVTLARKTRATKKYETEIHNFFQVSKKPRAIHIKAKQKDTSRSDLLL